MLAVSSTTKHARIERDLTVRGYELDRHGRVSLSTVLLYTEHLRWEAFRDPETGFGGIIRGGGSLPIRAQRFCLGAPIDVGTDINVSMAVTRVGTTSIELLQEITRKKDGELVLQALVTGVYVGQNKKTQPIPVDLRERVDASLSQPQMRGQFIDRPKETWSTPISIRHSDIDILQHVNQARYIDFMRDSMLQAIDAHIYGPDVPALDTNPLQVGIEYNREIKLGEALRIYTWRGADMTYHFAGHVGDEETCRFRAWAVFN